MSHKSHFTRSKVREGHKSAGVLPFSFTCGSQCYVLLGSESTRTGPQGKARAMMWRDFGGRREAADADDIETASREFAEETMGMFGSCNVDAQAVAHSTLSMAQLLREGRQSLKVVYPLKLGAYHMFLACVPFVDALMLQLATQQACTPSPAKRHTPPKLACPHPAGADLQDGSGSGSSSGHAIPQCTATASPAVAPVSAPWRAVEKAEYCWVLLTDVMACVAKPKPRYFLTTQHRLGPGQKGAYGGRGPLQLHPCFAASLRLARDAGLQQLVAVCRHMGAGKPLPPARALVPAPECALACAAAGAWQEQPPEQESVPCVAEALTSTEQGAGAEEHSRNSGSEQGVQQGQTQLRRCMLHHTMSYWLGAQQVAAGLGLTSGAAVL